MWANGSAANKYIKIVLPCCLSVKTPSCMTKLVTDVLKRNQSYSPNWELSYVDPLILLSGICSLAIYLLAIWF